MNARLWSKRLVRIVSVSIAVLLFLYLIWNSSNGWGGSEMVTAVGLILVIGAMLYLKQMENTAEKNVLQRIKTEYPPESQSQVLEVYEHMKIKELEGLFLKILDDAHGDVNAVRKFAGLAENVGWKAYLENKW